MYYPRALCNRFPGGTLSHVFEPASCLWSVVVGGIFSSFTADMSSPEEKNTARHQFNQPFLSLSPEDATDKPVDTEIVGQIPEWLEGSLYRNGPGIFQVGETRLKHLFDGFSVLHKFHIHKGKATYMSRVLDSETWQNSVKAKRLIATQFGTYETPDPCKSTFAKLSTIFKPQHKAEWTDNVSVNIVEHGDRLYAMTETPTIVRVDPAELKAAGRENVAKTIAVHMSTAHPHFDEQGNMYNLGTAFNPPNNYNIIRIPPPSKEDKDAPVTTQAELVTSLKSRWMFSMGYNHSFGMSRDHFVILEQPITMSSFGFLTNNWRSAAAYDNFVKRPSEELIFRLVSRQNNAETAIKYRAEPTFTFHFVNCYEDDEHKALVVDFCGYSDLNIIDNLYLDNLDKEGIAHSVPTFRRYVLPLSIRGAAVGKNLVTLPHSGATATLRPDGTVFLEADYITNGELC
ncbi:retinal Mueller cells isomerohydrolase-like [Littorina saxatilis]|uniref:retinal Mueller cells isomerohydrolase-like n=1 Tax=Littorina saxatilis TaxID=31220 RepID=UPI0038B6B1A4